MPPRSTRKPAASRPPAQSSTAASLSSAAAQPAAPANQTQQQQQQQQNQAIQTSTTQSRVAKTPSHSLRSAGPVNPDYGLIDNIKTVRRRSAISATPSALNQATPGPSTTAATNTDAGVAASTADATGYGNNLGTIPEADTPIPTIEGDDVSEEEEEEEDLQQQQEEEEDVGNDDDARGNSRQGSVLATGSPAPIPRIQEAGPRRSSSNNSRAPSNHSHHSHHSNHSNHSRAPSNNSKPPSRQHTPPPLPDVRQPSRSPSLPFFSPPPPSTRSASSRHETPEADPNPGPGPGPGASNEGTLPDPPGPEFRSAFWQQVENEKVYFRRRRNIVPVLLAWCLFYLQVCSLGNICVQNSWYKVFLLAFRNHCWEYTCLLIANTFTFSGIMDIAQGLTSVVGEIGIRAAHKQTPELVNLEEEDIWKHFSILQDVYDKLMEPVLVLTLTFALRWVFDTEELASSILLVRVSLILRLTKLVCNTIAICYGDFASRLSVYSGAAVSWLRVRKRLFVLVLLLLAVFSIYMRRHNISFDPLAGREAAQWFNNARSSEKEPIWRVRIKHLPAEKPQRVGAIIHKVTNEVVTKWVMPAQRV